MNQFLSRRWALPPNLPVSRTRSPRPSDRAAESGGANGRRDPLEHVIVGQVDAESPGAAVSGRIERDTAGTRADHDRSAAA